MTYEVIKLESNLIKWMCCDNIYYVNQMYLTEFIREHLEGGQE